MELENPILPETQQQEGKIAVPIFVEEREYVSMYGAGGRQNGLTHGIFFL